MENQAKMSREAVGMMAKLFIAVIVLLVFAKGCSNFIFQNVVDTVFFSGTHFEENGEGLKAMHEYEKIVSWDQHSFLSCERAEESAFRIASILEKKLYRYKDAAEAYLTFTQDYPKSENRQAAEAGMTRSRQGGKTYSSLWQQADVHLKAGRYRQAEKAFQRIVEMAPLDIKAQLKVKESQALAESRMTKEQAISMVSMHLRTSGRKEHRVRFTSYWVKNSQSYRDSILIDIPVAKGDAAAAVWGATRACLQLLKHRFAFDLGKVVIRENAGGAVNPADYEAYKPAQVHDVEAEDLRAYNGGWKTKSEILAELKVAEHHEKH
jgi:tetratricopeptide (TPR) repeat protein